MDDIKVSIITICRNSAQDISKTLRSVLNQSYDNIEYIIVDGKSEDRTMEIIESYKKAFQEKGYTYRIISESDNGIYDAMYQGIDVCTGNLVGLINSGDWYESKAVSRVVEVYNMAKREGNVKES